MGSKSHFKIKFWGVRGSRPIPGKDTLKVGGNTPCVSVEIDDTLLILDSGTGICNLAEELMKSNNKLQAHIFITHTHWDHIQGFPFFTPAFIKGNEFMLYGQNKLTNTFSDLMRGQMVYEHYPVQFADMAASLSFIEVKQKSEIRVSQDIIVRTEKNNHPGGGLSYRIEYKGDIACCYVTDVEHGSSINPDLKSFIDKSDIVIYDTSYTDEEYAGINGHQSKVGWGHSTWQEGIKLMEAADAKDLYLFHHATYRTDKDIRRIHKEAKKRYDKCFVASEGLTVEI